MRPLRRADDASCREGCVTATRLEALARWLLGEASQALEGAKVEDAWGKISQRGGCRAAGALGLRGVGLWGRVMSAP